MYIGELEKMSKTFIYNHGGSENHGCEALVRTVNNLVGKGRKLCLLSEVPQQDFRYNIQNVMTIETAKHSYSRFSGAFLRAYVHLKKTGDYFPMDILPYIKSLKNFKQGDVEISVGGDIYCYEDYPKFIKLHELICKRGCKTILLGCSLEEKLFDDPNFLKDMKRYDYISARESLTYDLLKKAGLTNIGLTPDTAFTLEKELLPLPNRFIEGNTIGINVSPLVIRKENSIGIVYENFKYLIQKIIEKTDCAIALIPHVIWENNDDRTILDKLYKEFEQTGRIVLIEDCNCMQLKGYISRCRFFIGARTHATIAAYSTGVPTLVLGYSIKSRGIAMDLFGTNENYVISVQNLKKTIDLSNAFKWIWEHEREIRRQLETILPDYVKRTENLKENIEMIIGSKL